MRPSASSRLGSILVLVSLTTGLACGNSAAAIRVGESSLDRDGLLAWVSERNGIDTGTSVPSAVVVETITEWIINESLVDLLNEYGWRPDGEARDLARRELLAAGLDPEDPRLTTYTDWQAVRTKAASGGSEVRSAYEAYASLLSYDLCTSHVLVANESDAQKVVGLLEGGRDFADLARSLSQDPGSAAQGGSLGCVSLGVFVPSFERAALGAIKHGVTVVGPVPSPFGFHVIRIDDPVELPTVGFNDLGDRLFGAVILVATLTRAIEVDERYGIWDSAIGRVMPPDQPE